MLPKKSLFSFKLAAVFTLAFAAVVSAQKIPIAVSEKERALKAEAYQTQQRALTLNSLKTDIKMADDAPMRCHLRYRIARFFFETKLPLYHDSAVTLANECFDDIAENREQFSESQVNWTRNDLLSLLRKHAPAAAERAQKKYFTDKSEHRMSDFNDLRSGDPKKSTDKILSGLASGEIDMDFVTALENIGKADPASANRILSAFLAYFEADLRRTYSDSMIFVFVTSEFREAFVPVDIRRRFHLLLIRMAEASLADPENERLWYVIVNELKYSAADIKEDSPALYERFLGLFSALSSRKSDRQKRAEEVYQRIEASKDKLAQAISEAESAEDENFQSELWEYASNLALREKKYRQCADLKLKVKIYNENSLMIRARNFFLVNSLVEPALKNSDIESAEYINSLVTWPEMRSEGNVLIVERLVELKRTTVARDKLNDSLALMDKMENAGPKVRIMLSAIPAALKIDKMKAFDIASETVKVINRIPSPGPDDKFGTPGRISYLDKVLIPNGHNIFDAFRTLGGEDVQLSDAIAQGIQLKELRLVAQIALETQRKYPLPPETKLEK